MVLRGIWEGITAVVSVLQTSVQIVVWLYQLLLAAGLYLWMRTCGGIVAFSTLLMPGFMTITLRLMYDPPSVIVKDLPYGSERRQFVDVYLPQTGTGAKRIRQLMDRHGGDAEAVEAELRTGLSPTDPEAVEVKPGGAPVVVFLAGGAWTIGYKYWGAGIGFRLAHRGAVVITADYRQFPQTSVNGMLDDVGMAMRWASRNAARFGGDPDKIILLGQSAGAHLATLYTFRAVETLRYRAEGGVESGLPDPGHCGGVTLPAAVIGLSGVYDMQSAVMPFRKRGMTDDMVLGIFGGFDAEAMGAASPLTVLEGLAGRVPSRPGGPSSARRASPALSPSRPGVGSPASSAFASLLGSEAVESAAEAAGKVSILTASPAAVAAAAGGSRDTGDPMARPEETEFPSLPSSGAGTPRGNAGFHSLRNQPRTTGTSSVSASGLVKEEVGAGAGAGGKDQALTRESSSASLLAEAGRGIQHESWALHQQAEGARVATPGSSSCLEAARKAVLFVLLHGSGDGIASVAQAERLFEELQSSGWRATLGVYDGASHTGPLIEEAMGERDYLLEDLSDVCRHVSAHVDSRNLAASAGDTVRKLHFGAPVASRDDLAAPAGGPEASIEVQGRRGVIEEGLRYDSKPSGTAFGGHCSAIRRLAPDFLIWLGKAANPF